MFVLCAIVLLYFVPIQSGPLEKREVSSTQELLLYFLLLLWMDIRERWNRGWVSSLMEMAYLAFNLIKNVKERTAMRFVVSNDST